jgi:hypothetical protein
MEVVNEVAEPQTADSNEKSLYKIGGAAALICALMYLITLGIYIPANRASPPPGTVLEWFTLFQTNPLTGLFFLGLADIVIMILWGPMALAFYAALRHSNKTWSRVATAFIFVGMAVYLATNTAFSMLSLSRQYAAASTEDTGMPLAWLAGLIISVVMLRSKVFGRATAWAGILGLGLLLASIPFAGYTTTGPTTAVVSAIIAVTYIGGGLLSLAWYILVGRRLLRLGRGNPDVEGK